MEHFKEKWQAFVKSDTVSPPAGQSTAKAEAQQATEATIHDESLGWVENVLNDFADELIEKPDKRKEIIAAAVAKRQKV